MTTSPRDEAQLHLAPAPGRAGRVRAPPPTGRSGEPGSRDRPVGRFGAGAAAARAPGAGRLGGGAGGAGDARSATCRPPAGRCPGSLSRDVAELRERGLLAGHITAGPGLRRRARGDLGRRRARRRRPARLGRGPGRPRARDHRLRHASSATAGWRRSTTPTRRSRSGCRRLLSPRLSSVDPRQRHRGVSHHTRTVLELLLAPVEVAAPAGEHVPIAILATACGWQPQPARGAGRSRGLRRLRPADADDGAGDRGGPALLRRALAAGGCLRRKG